MKRTKHSGPVVASGDTSKYRTPIEVPDTEVFKFYLENVTAKAYTLPLKKIKEKYLAFLKTKDVDWVVYYGHQTVTTFVTSKEGLNSSIDVTELLRLEVALTKTRHTLYSTAKPKLKRKR